MTASWTDNVVEGAGFLAELAILFVVWKKVRWRTLPVFTILIAYAPLEDMVLVAASRMTNKQTYFAIFWCFAIVDYCLQLALIAEVARNVLKPAGHWIPGTRRQFAASLLIGSLAALWITLWMKRPEIVDAHDLLYTRVSFFTSLLTCLALLALSIIANRLRLPRKDHTRAVGQGIAAWNAACLIGDAARSTGVSAHLVSLLDYARMIVWEVVLLYWAYALWLGERSKEASSGLDIALYLQTPPEPERSTTH